VTTNRGKDRTAQASSGSKRTQAAQQIGLPRQAGSFAHYSVAQEIGRRIVSGDYPPGSILPNEAEWSEMFGTSRSVVREAIKMLMSKNLLVSRPKVGSRVEPREN
jgi:DNA-binding FadR family transcriptional regulator